MASTMQLLKTVNEMAGALDSGECRTMLYLCGHLDLDSNEEGLGEFLRSGVIQGQMNDLFLVELLFEVKRFDILWKLFSTKAHDVESALGNRHVLSRYRVLMVNINENITNGDIKNLIFLLSRTVPREKIDKVKSWLRTPIQIPLVCGGAWDGALQIQSLPHPTAPQQSTAAHCPTQTHSYPLQQLNHTQTFHNAPQISTVPVSTPVSQESVIEEYSLKAEQRGFCLIIDCVGADGERLEQAFRELHFRVELHQLLSAHTTESLLREVSLRVGAQHCADAFVCCIISRGTSTRLLATDPAQRGAGLDLDLVRHLFSGNNCPMLAGKPKLFFIQRYGIQQPSVPQPEACPGGAPTHQDSDLETDGVACSRGPAVPTDADVFWSHCWTSECQLEQGNHRSVYLEALTDGLLRGRRRKTNLVDIHTELNGLIYDHNKRNPAARYDIDLKHTLRRHLCLT
ncbi:CASP8 and FADD-like apoptosis regulator isoform X2 [Gadus chalcogrammus]|uniref:CASP8 and FADD-like apoptosis regulator isoform X2 n=1 Tax=Gadus chalcogrammus TaxID=1042646 RepID=UPI0024C4811F|nr:CASP8 and FADD-like apoptosis regulator isoform X2 [Gadus chalcogrammus]